MGKRFEVSFYLFRYHIVLSKYRNAGVLYAPPQWLPCFLHLPACFRIHNYYNNLKLQYTYIKQYRDIFRENYYIDFHEKTSDIDIVGQHEHKICFIYSSLSQYEGREHIAREAQTVITE